MSPPPPAPVLALPWRALEAAGGAIGEGTGQVVLDRLEGGADAVAQFLEPGPCGGLAIFDVWRQARRQFRTLHELSPYAPA